MLSHKQTRSKKSISSLAVSSKDSVAGQLKFSVVLNDIGNPKGEIRIRPIEEHMVNTDLSTWGKQFKDAFKAGQYPEEDLFKV